MLVANVLSGGAGNDAFAGLGGNDTIDGGAGFDLASYSDKTTSVVVTLNGATNAMVTVGGVAEDTIRNIENVIGGSGNDTLTGDGSPILCKAAPAMTCSRVVAADDVLDGGAGSTRSNYSANNALVGRDAERGDECHW